MVAIPLRLIEAGGLRVQGRPKLHETTHVSTIKQDKIKKIKKHHNLK